MECTRCGACCVAPDIAAFDKPLGVRCPHLGPDNLCLVYDDRPAVCRDYIPDQLCELVAAPDLDGRVARYLALFDLGAEAAAVRAGGGGGSMRALRRLPMLTLLLALAALGALGGCGGGDGGDDDVAVDAAGARDGASSGDGSVIDAGAATDGARSDGGSADASTTTVRYDSDGPLAVTAMDTSVTGGPRTFSVRVYLPAGAGPFPVVSLSPGLQQPATGYVAYGRRLASHGIIMLVRDDPGALTDTSLVTDDLVYLIATWLPAQHAGTGALGGKLDVTRVGLIGHSRGGKASLVAAQTGLQGKLDGWFGLDPVDSSTLSGGVQARTNMGTIAIPTVFFGASVASTCSPADDSYNALYPPAPSPSVLLVGTGAGHVQFQDPAACVACAFCTPAGSADGAVVLGLGVRYATAFFARELLADGAVGATLAGAGSGADVTAGRITLMSK